MGLNSLPKSVTRQRRDCDLNPDTSAPEFSMLTTRLPRQVVFICRHYQQLVEASKQTHTHTRLTALFPGLPG